MCARVMAIGSPRKPHRTNPLTTSPEWCTNQDGDDVPLPVRGFFHLPCAGRPGGLAHLVILLKRHRVISIKPAAKAPFTVYGRGIEIRGKGGAFAVRRPPPRKPSSRFGHIDQCGTPISVPGR